MKYSISNIAWLPDQDEAIAEYLEKSVISGIEIAPSRYFTAVEAATEDDFIALKERWNNLGYAITSLQSLLFGRPDLQLFGDRNSREKLLNFILNLSQKAEILEAGPLVFGSPANRKRGKLNMVEAESQASKFFIDLTSRWGSNSNYLVLEANPEVYNCDFVTKSSEALQIINTVNSQKLRWHLDLACTEAAHESSVELIMNSQQLPSHVHLSEFNLNPLEWEKIPLYRNFLSALKYRNYNGVVTLEMRMPNETNDIIRSIDILNEIAL